ncbi:MAG: hypothetical protein IKG56_04785 [Clostridia bacterium]|nr:hypothetical protein [Clostridia bacterium]
MEDITLERLLTDFRSVIDQINDIVDRQDIDQAREALVQIRDLVYHQEGIPLDEGVEQDYDHVLHQLLSQISGVIEVTRQQASTRRGNPQRPTGGEQEDSSLGEAERIEEEIAELQQEIEDINSIPPVSGSDYDERRRAIEERMQRIEDLRSRLSEISSQQGPSINDLEAEIARIEHEIENLNSMPPVSGSDYDERRRSIEERNQRIANLRNQIEEIERNGGSAPRRSGNPRRSNNIDLPSLLDSLEAERAELEEAYNRAMEESNGGANQRNQELYVALSDKRAQIEGIRNIIQDREESSLDTHAVDLPSLLDSLEAERAELEEAYNRAMEESNGGANQRNQDLYIALSRKMAEIRALRNVIQDLERDGETPTRQDRGGFVTDRLDLVEEAAQIGDHIFKAAEIRRELQERDVSREEFLTFYEAGIEHAREEQARVSTQLDDLENEVGSITNSESGQNLYEQLNNASQIENEEERNAARIRILEEIRRNFARREEYEELLRNNGFLDTEITSIELADRFEADVFSGFIGRAEELLHSLHAQHEDQRESIEIYEREIGRIRDELRTIEVAEGNLESVEQDNEEEKELRARQIRATIFGDPELEQEWNERVRRLVSHRTTGQRVVEGENGRYSISYDTIEDYPEYEEDAHFLNLDDYKNFLELTSLYENSGRDINFILRIIDDETRREYERLEAEQSGSGRQWLEGYLADKAEYVSSFHGFTNVHGVKYSTYRTAGSMLKGMKPVKGDLPATTRVGNAVENTFRFFGLRRPEFTRVDENGNRVSNGLGGMLTLATDALVIGGVAAASLAGPVGWATVGSAYAVRGGVLIGNRIAARRYYARHRDEIDANLPTLGQPSKDDQEVARKDFYRRVEGRTRFGSWLRAKNDRFFFRRRAAETHERIAQERIELSDAVIDERGEVIRQQAQENIETANRNQQVRQQNTRRAIRSQSFYNDVVRDPDSVDRDEALAAAARTGAVRSYNPTARGEDINPNSEVQRSEGQYVREEESYEQTEDLQRLSSNVGGTVAATAITVEEKYTARQQKQDRINKVLMIIGTAAARLGIEYLRTGFETEHTVTTQDPDKVVPGGTKQEPVYKTVTTRKLDGNKSISELQYDDDALSNVWHDPKGPNVVHEHYVRGNDPIRAFTLRATGADGHIKEVSLAQSGYGMRVDQHVYDVVDQDVSNLSINEAIELLRTRMPRQFEEYCEAVGLKGAATEEIAQNAIENGNMFGQTGTMAGWERILPSNLTTTTEQVLDHMKTVTLPDQVIPGAVHTTVETVFDPRLAIDASLQGAAAGAAMGLSDQLHEAAKQTKRVEPGTFEKRTPSLLISRLARRAQERFNQLRGREQQDDEQDIPIPEPEHEPEPEIGNPQADGGIGVPEGETDEPIVVDEPSGERDSDGQDVDPTIVMTEENRRAYRRYMQYRRRQENPMSFEEWNEEQRRRNNSARDEER